MTTPPLPPPPMTTSKMLAKINYFLQRGEGGGYPFAENSAKIINSIFEPFPYKVEMTYPGVSGILCLYGS